MSAVLGRRALLKGGVALGAGLTVGFRLFPRGRGATHAQTPGVFTPNQWLSIDRDGLVTITNSVPYMGQGSMTTTTIIIADELDADWKKIRVKTGFRLVQHHHGWRAWRQQSRQPQQETQRAVRQLGTSERP